jgi:hypothetical protein
MKPAAAKLKDFGKTATIDKAITMFNSEPEFMKPQSKYLPSNVPAL